jgi:hypothetical protein
MAASDGVKNNHTRLVLAALLTFAALTAVQTWPIAHQPAHWARVDNGDGALNIWAVNWVGTHLFRDPMNIADANIFYPERRTLALSEMMLVQGAIAAPAIALGAPPVLAFNVAVFAGFVLTGFAFCLLVQRWTGSWAAGYVGGSLAAFNAHTLVRIAHLQTLHLEFFALALFALDRLLVSKRFRDACLLAAAFALHAMTSIYLMVFAVWALLFATLARAAAVWRAGIGSMALRFVAAAALALLLLYPYLSIYLALKSTGLERGADDVIAASWNDYWATGARVHLSWSRPYISLAASYSFPGFVAMLLAAIAMLATPFRRDPRVWMCAAAGAGCLAASMAGRWPFYPALHEMVPFLQAVRVQAHLGQFVLLMIAVLAGFGVAAMSLRWGRARWWPVVAVALVIAVNAEALRAPIGFVWFDRVPAVYDALQAERSAVVVELPFPMPGQWFLNGPYMVNSTRHWHPLLNGYSGFRPDSYDRAYEAAREFPSDASLVRLHELGVTHVVVHLQAMGETRAAEIAKAPTLQQIASEGDIMIYRLRTR